MKFVKGIAMLLCLVTIFTSVWVGNLGIGAEDGASGDFKVKLNDNSVTSVVLPQDEKITLTVDENAGKQLRWQICADKSSALWVNISGQTKNFLTLSYAMVGSLLDRSGTTYVRCVADGKISTEVKVTLSYSVREPAASANEPVRKAQVLKRVNPRDLKSYTITINYIYEDGNIAMDPYIASIGEGESFEATVTNPPVVGYEPYIDEEKADVCKISIDKVTKDVDYTVVYKPTLVNFKIIRKIQDVQNDTYTELDVIPKTGLTGRPVGEGLAEPIDGFTALLYDTETKIVADGSTEIEILYDRNYYLVLFELDGGYGVEPIYARFGTTFNVNKPIKPGHEFKKWKLTKCGELTVNSDLETKYDLNKGGVTLPSMNLTYKAEWTEADATYSVVYWLENANDDDYSYDSSVRLSAGVNSTVSGDGSGKTYTGFYFDHADKDVTVKGDGTSVVNVYYKRNRWTLSFAVDEGWIMPNWVIKKTFSVKYGEDTTKYWNQAPTGYLWYTTKSGNTFYSNAPDMPNENLTVYGKSSNGSSTVHYYEKGTTTSIKPDVKVGSTGWSFTDEDYIDIPGFSYDSSRNSGNNYYLYYIRKSYTLDFKNSDKIVKSETTPYDKSLAEYKEFVPDYPVNLEPNAYDFAGWYITPECLDGTEVNWDTAKMPAKNMIVYAKWAPKSHRVRVYKTYALDDLIVNCGELPHGTYVPNVPEYPSNGNYTFGGWFYMDNGEKKAFDFYNMRVHRDLDIFAEWSANVLVRYTIHYQLADGTKIAEDTTGSALAGNTKTFAAKYGADLYADYQNGFYPQTNSHAITMNIDGGVANEFTFVYVSKPVVPYTVRYLEKGTNKVLHTEKYVANNKNSVVTEKFEQVERYMPDAYQKRLILSANEAENVLDFWYTEDNEHAYYLIRYWQQNLEGDGYTEFRTIQGPGTIGATITADPLTLTGFNYNSGESTASGTLTAEGLVLNLYYDRIEYTYTVSYLEHGTGNVLHNEKTSDVKYRYGKVVTENAIDIPGYSLVGEETKVLTIRDKNNVITFSYAEKQVSVKYVPVPADKGVLSIGSETVGAKTGTPNGSTPTANSGYRFVGWFTDEACTNPVPAEWVGADNKLVPQKNAEGLYDAATYYAKFESSLTTLNIHKTGFDAADAGTTFIFRIKGTDGNTKNIDLRVTIHCDLVTNVTVADLPVGSYTVTEESDWSWRYKPKNGEQTITLDPDGTKNVLTFENVREDDKWLSGDAYNTNLFKPDSN